MGVSSVGQVTASWNRLTAVINGMNTGVNRLSGRINALNANMLQTSNILAANTRAQAAHWGRVNTNIQRSHRSLTSYARTAMSFAKVAGVGLLTGSAAGLWGIGRMADRVSSGRQAAMGLGTTYGENTAFNIAFGRYGNVGGIMQSSMMARGGDPSAMTAMYAMGINPMASGGTTASVAGAYLDAVRAKVRGARSDFELSGMHQGFRMGDANVDMNMMMRLRHDPDSEYPELRKKFVNDTPGLNIQERSQKAWQDFTTSMETAGAKLTKIFAEGLDKLAPALSKLSEGLSAFLANFVNTGEFKAAVQAVADGIKWLGDYLAGTQWKTDFQMFVSGVGSMAAVVGKFMSMFGGARGAPGSGVSIDSEIASWSAYGATSNGGFGGFMQDTRDRPIGMSLDVWRRGKASRGAAAGGILGSPGLSNVYGGIFTPRSLRMPNGAGAAPYSMFPNLGYMPQHNGLLPGLAMPGGLAMPQNLPPFNGSAMGGASYHGGGDRREQDIAFFMSDAGGRYTREQAIGIVANIQHESGGVHNIHQVGGGGGYGLAQWTSPERKAAFRALFNKDITTSSREEQLAFITWELQNTEAKSGMRLRAAGSAGAASDIIADGYERHGSGMYGPNGTAARRATAIGIASRPLITQPMGVLKVEAPPGNNVTYSAANLGVQTR